MTSPAPAKLPNVDALTQFLAANPPKSALDMRRMIDGFAFLMNADPPEVGALHEEVAIADGVRADVAVPRGAGPHPVLVYLHGGGWVCGSPRTHRKLGLRFAEAGFLVVNVDYRLAPEHPFPTPFEDCLAAVRWAAREVARFGGDPDRLAIGGDSAGGNLAAAVAAALAREAGAPRLRAALLIYGVFDFAALAGSAPGVPGDAAAHVMELMVGAYAGAPAGAERARWARDPRVSPIHAAALLPPSHLVCGTADPLLAQARTFRDALARAGVAHECFEDEGMPHGYVQMEMLPAARPALDRMVRFLRTQLG